MDQATPYPRHRTEPRPTKKIIVSNASFCTHGGDKAAPDAIFGMFLIEFPCM
jgi:hypothetical protein